MTTIRSLSSSDIVIAQIELPSTAIRLWSIRLTLQGLWSIMSAQLGLWSLSSSSPGLGSITASLSGHQVSWQRLRPTHAFQYNTTVSHAVLPPAVCLLTRGSHCVAFRFMSASENIGCCAGFRSIASCTCDIPLVPNSWLQYPEDEDECDHSWPLSFRFQKLPSFLGS